MEEMALITCAKDSAKRGHLQQKSKRVRKQRMLRKIQLLGVQKKRKSVSKQMRLQSEHLYLHHAVAMKVLAQGLVNVKIPSNVFKWLNFSPIFIEGK